MTNGRFQVSEFNDSFPAINLKSGLSPGDPFLTVAFIESGQLENAQRRLIDQGIENHALQYQEEYVLQLSKR